MKWSFKVARILGIDLRIHATFFIIIVLGAMHWRAFGISGILFGALLTTLLFLCVTLHEFGHSIVAQRFGITVREIVLLPVGGVAMLTRNPDRPLQELLIAIAGPAVNVIIAALLAGYLGLYSLASGIAPGALLQFAATGPSWETLLIWLFNANIIIVLFNMIPAFPMDGGRVLRAILGFFLNWGQATRIATATGQLLAIVLGTAAIMAGHIMLAVVATIVFFAAGATRSDERSRAVLRTQRIGDAYDKYAITLDETDRVSRVVDCLLHSRQTDFAVLRDGQLIGAVSREQVLSSLQRSLGDEAIADVMTRNIPAVNAGDTVEIVRQLMDTRSCHLAAVYESGHYLGLASAEGIADAMVIIECQERRRPRQAPPPLPQGYPRPAM